jgi:hypothetical protein
MPCCDVRQLRAFDQRWSDNASAVKGAFRTISSSCEKRNKILIDKLDTLVVEIFFYVSCKRLDLINVILPDGCPSKRILPRTAEQEGRYSKGSQRRFFSPWLIQFPLRKRSQIGCDLGPNEFVELD